MTREEFESILEEAYIEGYNTAIEDIQEDILDEEAYDLEGEYENYTEAWKPNEFIDYKAQREYNKSGKNFEDLGKNKADFMRSKILPKLHAHLSRGGTFTKVIDDINKEGKDASTYFKRGHAVDQFGDYAKRVGKYLSYKASKKSK